MNAATTPPSTTAPIKVLLADDEGLVRSGFNVLIDVEDEIEDEITVVGEATTGGFLLKDAGPAELLHAIRVDGGTAVRRPPPRR